MSGNGGSDNLYHARCFTTLPISAEKFVRACNAGDVPSAVALLRAAPSKMVNARIYSFAFRWVTFRTGTDCRRKLELQMLRP